MPLESYIDTYMFFFGSQVTISLYLSFYRRVVNAFVPLFLLLTLKVIEICENNEEITLALNV